MTADLAAYRRARQYAPWEVIRNSEEWRPVAELLSAWARAPLSATSGYTGAELDTCEDRRGALFPMVLREWWQLAGRHPFVDPGLDPSGYHTFARPDARSAGYVPPKLTVVTWDDTQSGMVTGIHPNWLDAADPPTHAHNPNFGPDDVGSGSRGISFYDGDFQPMGLTVPQLVHVTLLGHLALCATSIDDAQGGLPTSLREGVTGLPRQPNAVPARSPAPSLGLVRYAHESAFGDVFTDGGDVIFYWLAGYLCRTPQALARVRAATSRECGAE